jgi:hypothetical protein
VASGTRVVADSSEAWLPARSWLGGEGADPLGNAERRAESLVLANRGVLRDLGVSADVVRRGGEPAVHLRSSSRVGAVPLLSPVTGRADFGLVVEPRFAWSSAGDVLAGTGFRVVPELLPLPDLPQSERRVPPWVLSSVVLLRLRKLLDDMQRRFVLREGDVAAPRGAVRWDEYATRRFPVGRALDVPCRFPDLRDDEDLRAAIHWTVRRHRDALLGQSGAGSVVRHLLSLCDEILVRVAGAPPRRPATATRAAWKGSPLVREVFREGVQAIDWTVEERGLAGLSDVIGLAWRMNMESFFEAWVEAIAERCASWVGAELRVGRREQTRVLVDWRPPSSGSQRSLLPDVVLRRPDTVVVLEAKYKRHAEQIERLGWSNVEDDVREQHRADVLQALAYSSLFDAPRVVACLVYPASPATWRRLAERGAATRRARVRSGARSVELALMAVPLSGQPDGPAHEVERLVRTSVDGAAS